MHNVFHISSWDIMLVILHMFWLEYLKVSDEGVLMAEPIRILDHSVWQLRRRIVDQVKVQWDNYSPHSMTCEDAYDMCQQFPLLFDR